MGLPGGKLVKIKGSGSLVRLEDRPRNKCRKWRLKVHTDHGIKSQRFTGSYSEAKAELEHFKAELKLNVSDITFGEMSEKWLGRRKRLYGVGEIKQDTYGKDASHVRILCEEFGGVRLVDLTKAGIQDGLLTIREKRNLGGTYLNSLHITMKAVLNEALDEGFIATNPMERMKAPKRDAVDRRALTRGEFEGLVRGLLARPLDAHIVATLILLFTGLRRGEVCALTWENIGEKVIKVRSSISDKGSVAKPKTPSSIRDVFYPPALGEVLRAWYSFQGEYFEAIGLTRTAKSPVISSAAGTFINPQNLDRWWRQNRESFGVPDVVLHEFRHTYATMLASDGASSRAIQDLLGWATLAMADVYMHRSTEAMEDAVSRYSLGLSPVFSGTPIGTLSGTSSPS